MAKENIVDSPDQLPGGNDNSNPDAGSNTPLVDVAGIVAPADPTEGALPPEPPVEPVKRGRPSGSRTKKKPIPKTDPNAVYIANAEMVTGALDLLRAAVSGGEAQPQPELRQACVASWAEYLQTQGLELPPWVQVTVISIAYTAPAFATTTAKGRIAGLWAKAKGWYVARRG